MSAAVSFVVFGRTAIPYRSSCTRIELHEEATAITRFEQCLRSIAQEYRTGLDAPVRARINTTYTDHVAALVEAEKLLPNTSSRAAVIFFTDGKHDPPGTSRDDENVVATYPIATVGQAANTEGAMAFIEFVLSEEGQAALAEDDVEGVDVLEHRALRQQQQVGVAPGSYG